MNWSSDIRTRGRVLRSTEVGEVGPTRADLGVVSSRAARSLVVSGELVESAKQEGYTAGFEEGYAAGYTQGIGDAQTHIQLLGQLIEKLGREAEGLASRETTAREQIEDQVVATAVEIAETVVGRELETLDGRGRDAIARALALAPERGFVTARLHPADIAVIGDPAQLQLGRTLELVADSSLAPGDCIVEVNACRVDARIAPALERLREVTS
jgi:flagellar assembly protein FliH